MTIVEKILARASGLRKTSPGEYVTAKIDVAMMPEMFQLLRTVLSKGGIQPEALQIWDRERFFVILDHRVPAFAVPNAETQKSCREFAKKLKVKYFYDVFPGIGHQIMMEKGHVRPGELIVGADSHTTTYGALNAAATGIGTSEMAYVIQTGELWFRVPETMKFVLTGSLPEGVYSKDVILEIIRLIGVDGALYKAMEFTGKVIDELSVEARFTIANMAIEAGAKSGIINPDEKTIEYVRARSDEDFTVYASDPDAEFSEVIEIDCSGLEPLVAFPHLPSNSRKAREAGDMKIDQVYIGSCTNGRIEDLRIAARILRGRKVAEGTRCIVVPASTKVWRQAMKEGLFDIFSDARCVVSTPTCGACLGGYMGILASGERCVSTTNRNFVGRMGSPESEVY
ncbi:MAG: 3-isopropylmalate dehydratase large subunit, partial [Deltaproteobacteria bacterium]